MSGLDVKDQDALYYPWIHIRDPAWLKATLLVFPHVVRMVPLGFPPRDGPAVYRFTIMTGRRSALLRQAKMYTPGVQKTLRQLKTRMAREFNKDSKGWGRRYGREATLAQKPMGHPGFQMHPGKAEALIAWLEKKGLAWKPKDPDWAAYLEMNPQLGEAVMATLALACARDEGLHIVTDPAGGRLHRAMIELDEDGLYDAVMGRPTKNDARNEEAVEADGEMLLELIVYQGTDSSKVKPEAIAALHAEWEALAELRKALQELAGYVPRATDPEVLREYLRDKANDALRRWSSDRANMRSFRRAFWGEGARKPTETFMSKIGEKVCSAQGAAAAATATGTAIGYTRWDMLGAAAGFGIGLVTHAVASWRKIQETEATSRFRYLTMMEKAGVVFALSGDKRLKV